MLLLLGTKKRESFIHPIRLHGKTRRQDIITAVHAPFCRVTSRTVSVIRAGGKSLSGCECEKGRAEDNFSVASPPVIGEGANCRQADRQIDTAALCKRWQRNNTLMLGIAITGP